MRSEGSDSVAKTVRAELSLALRLCHLTFARDRWPPADLGRVDWALFLRLVRFHRVQGLVWSSLASSEWEVPLEILDSLAIDAASIAASNLCGALECANLLEAFEGRGLPMLFLKGLTLGAIAYGTIATKSGVDIDILIRAEQLSQAVALLRELGYRPTEPAENADLWTIERWHRARKDSTWLRRDTPHQVDLHTRLADNRRLIPSIGLASTCQWIELPSNIRLPTLGKDELFAYLAVHGASSAWFRLKWITDFAALIHRDPPEELDRLYLRSQELGAGRAAGQALLLAESLFGTLSQSTALRGELRRERGIRILHRAALNKLAGNRQPREPTENWLGTLTIHWTQLLIERRCRFFFGEMLRQLRLAVS